MSLKTTYSQICTNMLSCSNRSANLNNKWPRFDASIWRHGEPNLKWWKKYVYYSSAEIWIFNELTSESIIMWLLVVNIAGGKSIYSFLAQSQRGPKCCTHQRSIDVLEPYLKSFFVRTSDLTHIKLLELEILTNLATAKSTYIPIIVRKFRTHISSSDNNFVAATILAVGRCAASIVTQ